MKRSLAVMAAFVGLFLVGCGGAPLEAESEPVPQAGESGTVSQFATCTATCGVGLSVSCTGTTCSSTDYQGVTCNGVFTSCSQATCSGLPACSRYANWACSPNGATMNCCNGSSSDSLICSNGRWLYY
ncbi:hypothetical protein ACLESO_49705 [Pyxidicoccus sp. 3LG]